MTALADPVEYIALVLDAPSRSRLLAAVPPRHQRVTADHITLVYAPSASEMNRYRLGARASCVAFAAAEDERGQAVAVRGLRTTRQATPHVTISLIPDEVPAYSNELLAGGVRLIASLRLSGVVEARRARSP